MKRLRLYYSVILLAITLIAETAMLLLFRIYPSLLLTVLLIALPSIALICLMIGATLARQALRPASDMAAQLHDIHTGQDLSLRLSAGEHDDEFSVLAQNLNEMLDRLEASFAYEQRFSSNVSHELRTPLSVILSECEIAMAQTKDDAALESFREIRSQARRILSMCNQLLELSRHASGKSVMDREVIDLSLLCRSVMEDMMPRLKEAGVQGILEIEDDLHVLGDETLLIRLISNLLENALKYRRSDTSSYIRLTLYAQEDGMLRMNVVDNGIGIRTEDIGKIFDRFYKAESSRPYENGSFGLGLALVKWIVEAHGGNISVQSSYGQGSLFICRFPAYTQS